MCSLRNGLTHNASSGTNRTVSYICYQARYIFSSWARGPKPHFFQGLKAQRGSKRIFQARRGAQSISKLKPNGDL